MKDFALHRRLSGRLPEDYNDACDDCGQILFQVDKPHRTDDCVRHLRSLIETFVLEKK